MVRSFFGEGCDAGANRRSGFLVPCRWFYVVVAGLCGGGLQACQGDSCVSGARSYLDDVRWRGTCSDRHLGCGKGQIGRAHRERVGLCGDGGGQNVSPLPRIHLAGRRHDVPFRWSRDSVSRRHHRGLSLAAGHIQKRRKTPLRFYFFMHEREWLANGRGIWYNMH